MKLQESDFGDLILHATNSKTVEDFLEKVKDDKLVSNLNSEELEDFYMKNKNPASNKRTVKEVSVSAKLDAMARDHTELELFMSDALSSDDLNLAGNENDIRTLKQAFKDAHKQHDMSPMQVTEKKLMMKKEDILKAIKEVLTEKKATYCGRCGHTHVKGTPCPRPFKESVNETTMEVSTTDGTETTATPDQKIQIKNARTKGTTITFRKKGVNEDIDLGHEDDEPHMIKSELYKIAKYALELYKMVDQFEGRGEVDFPAWWQSKITKATSMISSAKHYLEFELTEPAMDQAVVGAEAPINEGNLGHNELASLEPEGRFWIVTYRTMDGKKEKVFTDEDEARAFMGTVSEAKKKLDPVGHEDEDIDNDGKENTKTDKYLKGRRVKIGQAIAQHSKK